MKVKVKLLRNNGRFVRQTPGVEHLGYVGELQVGEGRDLVLGRPVVRARLLEVTSGIPADILPELIDARLLWAKDTKWRLAGYERIADVDYAQAWSVELV